MGGNGDQVTRRLLAGRYQIDRALGRGGMGAVYLARDQKLADRLCAVKELLEVETTDDRDDCVRRFAVEAEALAKLNHPGIPQVYDRFEEGGRYYLVMEYVAGEDLGTWLRRHLKETKTPPQEAEIIDIALQVCDILAYLHAQDPPIVHRDIKPGNLVRTHSGRLKLVDFGIAKVATSGGTVVGTHGYAPPEQYRGESEPCSDLFALGATLHFFLSGRDPQKQAPFDFVPLQRLVRSASAGMAALVGKLLELNPDDRLASAEAVIETLQGLGVPVEGEAIVRPDPAAQWVTDEAQVNDNACPLCGADVQPGIRFCRRCGARADRRLPILHIHRRSDDLGLRIPPHLFRTGNYEWVTGVEQSGRVLVVLLLKVEEGAAGAYVFLAAREERSGTDRSILDAPVEVYRCDIKEHSWHLRAILAGERRNVDEAVRIWGRLTVRRETDPIG